MNDSPQPGRPGWISPTLVALLAAQVGLLWLCGGLLNRQNGEIMAMREDIQDLTEAVDNITSDQAPATEDGNFQPAASHLRARPAPPKHRHHAPHFQRASFGSGPARANAVLQDTQEKPQDEQDQAAKDIKEANESAKKAVAEARDTQQKLSLSENARKAEEKKKVESATASFLPIVYAAMAIGILAFIIGRVWRARSGGR